jgi:hypothetical protein
MEEKIGSGLELDALSGAEGMSLLLGEVVIE